MLAVSPLPIPHQLNLAEETNRVADDDTEVASDFLGCSHPFLLGRRHHLLRISRGEITNMVAVSVCCSDMKRGRHNIAGNGVGTGRRSAV